MIDISLYQLMAIVALVTAVGFGFGSLAVWYACPPSEDSRLPQPQVDAPTPLRQAGYFPAEPESLWSEHTALLQAHEREIRQMIAAAPQLEWKPGEHRWEGPY